MKANVLRSKTPEALRDELEALLREQFNLRMQKGGGQLAKPDRFKAVRRDIARIKTVMAERTRVGD